MNAIQLLLSDARGVYIPRDFCQNFDLCQWHIKEDYQDILSNPNNEFYWDHWDVVCSIAYFVDESGNKWILLQEGDLWAVCYELMTDEEKYNFGFDE